MAKNGQFVWFDLLTTDIDAAKAFYTTFTGWSTAVWEGPNEGMPPYLMWTIGEGPQNSIGGVMVLPDEAKAMGAPPHWMAHIQCADVDALVDKAKSLGATLFAGPFDLPSVGRMATLADPFGAVFSAFTPEGEMSDNAGPTRDGDFGWKELATNDYGQALSFYKELFGWVDSDAMDMGEGWMYQMFKLEGDETARGGIFNKPAEMPMAAWLYYIKVPNVNAAIETIEANGGKLLNGPQPVPGDEVVAQFQDPQGAHFAIHGPGVVA